jgi:hypothetical protein
MSNQVCSITIKPASAVTSVNVRTRASRSGAVIQQLPVNTAGLRVIGVQADEQGERANTGRVFNWLQITLPSGRSGFVRDDLVVIVGDCAAFGYGSRSIPERAVNIVRQTPPPPPPVVNPAPNPVPNPAPTPSYPERVRKAAFNITAAFEGGGYATYQNFDAGIVSYGRFQVTLAAGSLAQTVELYLTKGGTGTHADALRAYLPRLKAKDATLRTDLGLKTALLGASVDPLMQQAQDEIASRVYWKSNLDYIAKPRGIVTPLGLAFAFDSAVNAGAGNTDFYFGRGESLLGVPRRSRIGANGRTEQQIVTEAAKARRDAAYAQAARQNLGGLRVRADFWLNLIAQGDWELQGDSAGDVLVKVGRKVQVKNP